MKILHISNFVQKQKGRLYWNHCFKINNGFIRNGHNLCLFSDRDLSRMNRLNKLNNNSCNLIDIRDVRELERLGRIENSSHIPRGMLEFWMDPDSQYFNDGNIDMDKEMVLFCAGGLRSALATKTLQNMGFKNICHVDGGFGSMQSSGFKVIK